MDKETLEEALLDTVRQRQSVGGAPRRTESDDNSWKEIVSDPPPKLASKREKTGSSRKKPKPSAGRHPPSMATAAKDAYGRGALVVQMKGKPLKWAAV